MSGTQLKLRGIEKVKRNNSEWFRLALLNAERFVQLGEEFTSDSLRHFSINEAPHPNAWGAVFSILARQGRIVRVGYRPSTLPSTHGRIVSVWKGVQ